MEESEQGDGCDDCVWMMRTRKARGIKKILEIRNGMRNTGETTSPALRGI